MYFDLLLSIVTLMTFHLLWVIERSKYTINGGHMKKIKENNLAKMEKLYELYESKMNFIAYGILSNAAQSEDVVQDSFIKLSDYLDRIKDVEDAKTKRLALKIVKTTAINAYRRNRKEIELFEYAQEEEIEDPVNIIDVKILHMHNHAMLDPIISDMPDIYKEVIELLYYYELSTSEISEITGLDKCTIRKRNERAKKYIIDRIGGFEDEKESAKFATELRRKNI